ncbi:MAG: hypothetical protein M3P49_16145 [Actinomycetota bacterium]|nr:hypothetical protein [Actinomycetota bacterium]
MENGSTTIVIGERRGQRPPPTPEELEVRLLAISNPLYRAGVLHRAISELVQARRRGSGGGGPAYAAAAFLAQVIYAAPRGTLRAGWWHDTAATIRLQLGLTRQQQLAARKLLVSFGCLNEEYARLHHRMYFRVDYDASAFWRAVLPHLEETEAWIASWNENAPKPDQAPQEFEASSAGVGKIPMRASTTPPARSSGRYQRGLGEASSAVVDQHPSASRPFYRPGSDPSVLPHVRGADDEAHPGADRNGFEADGRTDIRSEDVRKAEKPGTDAGAKQGGRKKERSKSRIGALADDLLEAMEALDDVVIGDHEKEWAAEASAALGVGAADLGRLAHLCREKELAALALRVGAEHRRHPHRYLLVSAAREGDALLRAGGPGSRAEGDAWRGDWRRPYTGSLMSERRRLMRGGSYERGYKIVAD